MNKMKELPLDKVPLECQGKGKWAYSQCKHLKVDMRNGVQWAKCTVPHRYRWRSDSRCCYDYYGAGEGGEE